MKIFDVLSEFREDGIHAAPSDTLKHTRTKWVAFNFADTNVNVIDLLDKAIAGINNLAKELYQRI